MENKFPFQIFRFQAAAPFIVCADFEAITQPTGQQQPPLGMKSFNFQDQIPCSVGFKLISRVPYVNMEYRHYTGPDCTQWFLDQMLEVERVCVTWLKRDKRIHMNPSEERRYEETTQCYLCYKAFDDNQIATRKVNGYFS